MPWYSFAQQDWIKADKASEFTGSAYNQSTDTLREQRELGMKQYEMTDHLGNVLAAVLDRKTGYGNSAGNYTGFSADVASITDYYPFGFPMSERVVGTQGRFGLNGIEKTNEVSGVGNHYTALYGEYNPRIVWRWNTDPKPTVGISPYAMFNGNPVFNRDILLDSAWAIKNQWNGKMIDKYEKEVPNIIKGFEDKGQTFTCEDLALATVMTFAKDNNLPFKWETGSGTFDAASDKYKDFATFKQDVLSFSGAPDFQRNDNAFSVGGRNGMFVGGVILNDHRSTGIAHHIQVVTRVVSAYSVATQSMEKVAFVIKQGNFRDMFAPRYLGSDNPKSSRYLGVPVQTGFYDAWHDVFTNISRDNEPQSDFSTAHDNKLEFRLFNFFQWNKKDKE